MEFSVHSNCLEDTLKLASKLAIHLNRKDIILLQGDLGAGKTAFAKGIGLGLNIKDTVISPTFNILKCYFKGKVPLYHIDAYRLEKHNKDIGLEEYIEGNGIAMVEWPDHIKELLNVQHLEIKIINKGNSVRELTFMTPNKYYEKIIRRILK